LFVALLDLTSSRYTSSFNVHLSLGGADVVHGVLGGLEIREIVTHSAETETDAWMKKLEKKQILCRVLESC
jgi:hypothetical protein